MLRRVPAGTSRCFGTTAVRMPSGRFLMNLTWLPFCEASANPATCSLRTTSRYGSGSSRPNLYLYPACGRRYRGPRFLEMEFKGFAKIFNGFVFGASLACYVYVKALRYEPVAFPLNAGRERLLHRHLPATCHYTPNNRRFSSATVLCVLAVKLVGAYGES